MTINWKVNDLTRSTDLNGLEDVVTAIEWEASTQETVGPHTHTKFKRGNVAIAPPDVSNFTNYASITEANALAWVKTALGDEVQSIENELDSLMTESKTTKIKIGTPWGPSIT